MNKHPTAILVLSNIDVEFRLESDYTRGTVLIITHTVCEILAKV